MPTVRTQDGVYLSYKTFGSGPTSVLFMHGWGGSGGYFDELFKYLDLTGLRLIVYDLRGHGASDKAATGYTLDTFAQDAMAVADHAKADKVVLVGYSMSSKFAQYVACVYPERISGLILIGPIPAAAMPIPDELRSDWVNRAGNREKMMEVTRMFLTQPVREEVIERWGDDAAKIPPIALDQTLKMCSDNAFDDRLSAIQIPILVVAGIHDGLLPPDAVRQLIMPPLPRARLVLLDCNHEIPLEKPQELTGLLQAFLAGLQVSEKVSLSAL